MEEKREAVRWSMGLPVRYHDTESLSEGTCFTEDMSSTGARLALIGRMDIGDHLNVMFDLPGQFGVNHFRLEAKVVWRQKKEDLLKGCNHMVGVAFMKIPDRFRKVLLDYIHDCDMSQLRQHWWKGLSTPS